MQVCIAIMHGKPVLLELRDGIPHINGEAQPIKQLTEEKLAAFQQELDAIPQWTCSGMPWATNASTC